MFQLLRLIDMGEIVGRRLSAQGIIISTLAWR